MQNRFMQAVPSTASFSSFDSEDALGDALLVGDAGRVADALAANAAAAAAFGSLDFASSELGFDVGLRGTDASDGMGSSS